MTELIITPAVLSRFRRKLLDSEKSPATVEKSIRDAAYFTRYLAGLPASR